MANSQALTTTPPPHPPLIIQRRDQQQQQRWIQYQPMQKTNKRAVVTWKIYFKHKVWKQKQYHSHHLYPDRKHYIFSFAEQRIDQTNCEKVIEQKPDAPVDQEFVDRCGSQVQNASHINPLKKKDQQQCEHAGKTNNDPEKYITLHFS